MHRHHLTGLVLLLTMALSACSDSTSSEYEPVRRPAQADATSVNLIDLSWRAKAGEWWWLSHDSTVTQKSQASGQNAEQSRLEISRRIAVGVLETDNGGHPTRLSFRVDVHRSTSYLFDQGEWHGIPESVRSQWPPPGTKFSATWDGDAGRWVPEADAPPELLKRATADLRAMLESRFLREELPESMVQSGGSWKPVDPGRLAAARELLGPQAEYQLSLQLLPTPRDVTDEQWHVLSGTRRLKGKLGDSSLNMSGTSELLVAQREPFRTHLESSANSTTTDPETGAVVHTTIETRERFEPLLQ